MRRKNSKATKIYVKRTETNIVLHNTVETLGLGNFSKRLGRGASKAAKNFAVKIAHNPTGATQHASNVTTAAATEGI